MNNKPFDSVVYSAAADTVESLAMMFLLAPDEISTQDPTAQRQAACVAFSGPFSGYVLVDISLALQSSLAGNMLGLETGMTPSNQQEQDALKELANVICGNLLPALAGPVPVFHMDPPQLLTPQEASEMLREQCVAGQAQICTEAGRLDVSLLTFAPVPQTTEA